MNYLFKVAPVFTQKQNLTAAKLTPAQKQNLTAPKLTPSQRQIASALSSALSKINTTTSTNIKTLNSLVSTASASAANADASAKIASEKAKDLTAMIATINDLVSKMDLANVDIDSLQKVCNNIQTISGMHGNNLYLLNSSIDILFNFFFHRASNSGIKLDLSGFKIVDTENVVIPTYLPTHVTYVS